MLDANELYPSFLCNIRHWNNYTEVVGNPAT